MPASGGRATVTAKPPIVGRKAWQEQMDESRVREKAHTRDGDAVAATRQQLSMVEVDATTIVIGTSGELSLLEAFGSRSQLVTSYHVWHTDLPAADQCEGCIFHTGHVLELSYLQARNVTFAVFCQGPYNESARYRDFMG